MKLKSWFFVLVLFLSVFSFSFVSAQSTISQDIAGFIDGLTQAVEPIARLLLGNVSGSGDFSTSEVLFSKVLLMLLLLSVLYVASGKIDFFSTNRYAQIIFVLVISLLATRWLGDANAIQTLILPYTALGMAFSAFAPFAAWFLLVNVGMKKSAPAVRKSLWIVLGVAFVFLWIVRYPDLVGALKWIYPITFLLCFVMVFWDNPIRRFFLKIELQNMGRDASEESVIHIKKRIAEIPDLVTKGVISTADANRLKKELGEKLKFLIGSSI